MQSPFKRDRSGAVYDDGMRDLRDLRALLSSAGVTPHERKTDARETISRDLFPAERALQAII